MFVAEADESDGSFLMFAPTSAVVTNVEADHLDNYGDFAKVKEAFAGSSTGSSRAARSWPAPTTRARRELAQRARRARPGVRTYGEAEGADLRVTGVRPARPRRPGSASTGRRAVELSVRAGPAQRAERRRRCVAGRAGPRPTTGGRAGLAAFGGARRRLERKGEAGGVEVFDSYAHHPTELTADLRRGPRLPGGEGRRPDRRGLPAAPVQPHPRSSPPSSARRSAWPTRSSCWTSTGPARTPSPA